MEKKTIGDLAERLKEELAREDRFKDSPGVLWRAIHVAVGEDTQAQKICDEFGVSRRTPIRDDVDLLERRGFPSKKLGLGSVGFYGLTDTMGWDNKLVRSYPRERKGWIIGALSLIALFHLSHVLSEDRQPTGDQAENTAPGDSPPMLPEITAPADSPPKLPGRLEYRLALVVEANAVGEILVGTSLRVNSVLALVDKARYFRLAEKAEMVNKVEPDLRLTGGEFERMSQQLIYVGLTFESAGGRLPEAADRHALKNRLKETSEFKVDKVARLAKVLGLEGQGFTRV